MFKKITNKAVSYAAESAVDTATDKLKEKAKPYIPFAILALCLLLGVQSPQTSSATKIIIINR